MEFRRGCSNVGVERESGNKFIMLERTQNGGKHGKSREAVY